MFRFCLGVIVGVFLEQNYHMPSVREWTARAIQELEKYKKPPESE